MLIYQLFINLVLLLHVEINNLKQNSQLLFQSYLKGFIYIIMCTFLWKYDCSAFPEMDSLKWIKFFQYLYFSSQRACVCVCMNLISHQKPIWEKFESVPLRHWWVLVWHCPHIIGFSNIWISTSSPFSPVLFFFFFFFCYMIRYFKVDGISFFVHVKLLKLTPCLCMMFNDSDKKHKNCQQDWAANRLQAGTWFKLFTISWFWG